MERSDAAAASCPRSVRRGTGWCPTLPANCSRSLTKKKASLAMLDLPDVNVWLALATDAHVHHKRARRSWETEAADALVFCRITQLSLLRHLTNPQVMGEGSLRPAGAWSKYREFAALPEIEFYGEASEIDEWLQRFISGSRT